MSLLCDNCGEPLIKEGDHFVCRHCGSIYEENHDALFEGLAAILGEAKMEKLAASRRLLYEASHAKYPSKQKVVESARRVLEIHPDDYLAKLYLLSHDDDPYELNRFLAEEEANHVVAEEAYRWLLPSLNPRSIGAFVCFIDKHFEGKEKTDHLTKAEEEAAKLEEGVYETGLPRDVFLAYSSADMPKVLEVMDLLEENGFVTFAAFRNLRHGKGSQENYLKEIYNAMAHCKVFVYLSSNASRSVSCDALKVELPHLIADRPNMPRVEFLLDDYSPRTPFMVKRTLKEAFPEQEYCRDEEDLLIRIDGYLHPKKATPKPVEQPKPVEVKPTSSSKEDDALEEEAIQLYKDKKYEKALPLLLSLAKKGRPRSMYQCGTTYYYGRSVPIDYQEAFSWYKKAAEAGHAAAMNEVGLCYTNGLGVAKDLAKGNEWLKKAADGGSLVAKKNLGVRYLNGSFGMVKDQALAIKYLLEASDGGHASASYELGTCYRDGKGVEKDDKKSFSFYWKAAEKGHVDAMNELAICYSNGIGTTKDLTKGNEWMKKSADGGCLVAKKNLGVRYLNGTFGMGKDQALGIKYLQQAAEGGIASAQFELGSCYLDGKGVAKDISKAVQWLTKAAEKNHADACLYLGDLYHKGVDVPEDYDKAFFYFQRSTNGKKTAPGLFNMGLCYEFGHGTEKNLKKAVEFYEKAIEEGSVSAMLNLGVLYCENKEGFANPSRGLELVKRAAEGGKATAMFDLYLYYRFGRGVTQIDEKQAHYWLDKAAEKGHAKALEIQKSWR